MYRQMSDYFVLNISIIDNLQLGLTNCGANANLSLGSSKVLDIVVNSLGILSAGSGLESGHALPSKDAVDLVGAVSSQLDNLGALQTLGLPCPVNRVSIPVGS